MLYTELPYARKEKKRYVYRIRQAAYVFYGSYVYGSSYARKEKNVYGSYVYGSYECEKRKNVYGSYVYSSYVCEKRKKNVYGTYGSYVYGSYVCENRKKPASFPHTAAFLSGSPRG